MRHHDRHISTILVRSHKYTVPKIKHFIRLRDMVTWPIANTDMNDRQFVDELRSRYGLSKVTAYAD